MISLNQLNAASQAEFVQLLDGSYEHSPWIADQAWARRPFTSLAQLKLVLVEVVRNAGREAQLTLIRAHPELAGRAMVSKTLTAESTHEQGKAWASPGQRSSPPLRAGWRTTPASSWPSACATFTALQKYASTTS